jgi:hypothetical protein
MPKPTEKEILKERAIGKLLELGFTESELRALEIIK